MNKKERASAMVLAVLILAFFMTLSLNMYFLAEKKAQRAGLKSEGTTILSDIDASSTLGYYELYLASEYLLKGFVTSSGSSIYNPSSTPTITGTTVAGIKLQSYTEYFSSKVSGQIIDDSGTNVTGNAILTTETAVGVNRAWNIVDGNIAEIWETAASSPSSIGGYILKTLEKTNVTLPYNIVLSNLNNKADFMNEMGISALVPTASGIAVYEKNIEFGNGSILGMKSSKFRIKVTRNFKLKYVNLAEYEVTGNIDSIEVIKQDP